MKRDVYQTITDQIVELLEQGAFAWHKPWSTAHLDGRVTLPLRHNGTPYRGVNILSLWMQSMAKGYACAGWMTFKQAIDLGGCVRKGEKGSPTVYAYSIHRMEQARQPARKPPPTSTSCQTRHCALASSVMVNAVNFCVATPAAMGAARDRRIVRHPATQPVAKASR
ncbi:ArdC family protein [Bradyrhizobium sp. CCBAU 21362]|uniref:ArdC family protein n=1 Tax=Bradyrhizobium sp. CCBAU 21362 TaxID=1325082 RepID=UPI00230616F9|nr:ArdC family protein [Bradyrhizobium sp. CCBAU 21362]